MKSYTVLENCHYQGVTWRKGQVAHLPQDPQWPERFKLVPEESVSTSESYDNNSKRTPPQKKGGATA